MLFLVAVVHLLLCRACELSVSIGIGVCIRTNTVCMRLGAMHSLKHLLEVLKDFPHGDSFLPDEKGGRY